MVVAAATWEDVAIALGRPASSFTPEQQAQITYWLTGIEIIIKARLGDLTLLDQDALKYVETEAVAAKVPPVGAESGETSVTIGIDDGNVTRRWDKPATADDITQAWWELLAPRRASAAFSTRPSHAPDTCGTAVRTRWRP